MNNCLYVVVPCYNEEEVLRETAKRLKEKFNALIKEGKIDKNSRITFVNDGSKDKTWEIIKELHKEDKIFSGVNLSRNRGHQNALLAGLMTVKDLADMVISMDADLQDDINAVDGMVEKYMQGADIVYGVRNKRETDTFFKRFTAEGYYKVMKKMGVDLVFNHADYRLMSKRALAGLEEFKEVNLFLRGIVPQIGYKTDIETYERGERFAGESKYPLKKMLSFAWQGITSFSVKPMDVVLGLGGFISGASFIAMIAMLICFLCGISIKSWMVVLGSIWLSCGLVMFSIGIVGAYIGKIYMESKERPRFIIEEFINK
ncbi:MAG: glycosyltransferase family 2 protein [Lachnospiraceae bacterium]|nr:glycosyltransferase family 2 protein [Lachnospiraceae bacterium]